MKKMSKTLSVIMAMLMILAVIPITASAATDAIKLNETKSVTAPKDAYAELTFTPEADGKYVVYSDNGGNDEIDPYVYIYDSYNNQIASDDDNDYTWEYDFCCIFEAEAGEVYYLQFCAYDDTVTYDVTVINYAEISHQPTESEPYVEIAPEANASYQWFKVREGEAEITDKYIVDVAELDTTSAYSASKGWTPANEPAYYDADKDFYQFFWIYLEEGDKLTLDINGTVEEYIGIESKDVYIDCELTASETNGSYTFEVEHTGVYIVYCYGVPGLTAKATVNGTYLEVVDGATDATLTPDEACKYICNVTYDGGRYELSDTFEVTEIAVAYPEISLSASASKVDYKSSVELNASVENMPANAKISWFLDGSAFAIDADDKTCTATSIDKGTSTITVKILLDDGTYATDANGNVISDSVEITAAYTWWQWIIRIVLFGWIWY